MVNDTNITLTWTYDYWGGGNAPLSLSPRMAITWRNPPRQTNLWTPIANFLYSHVTPKSYSLTRTVVPITIGSGPIQTYSYSPYSNVVSATVKAPVLQTPVVSGTQYPLDLDFLMIGGMPSSWCRLSPGGTTSQAGPFNEIAQISGSPDPKCIPPCTRGHLLLSGPGLLRLIYLLRL